MGARTVIPVEPSPPVIAHLLVNLALNSSSAFDLRGVGTALGSIRASGVVYGASEFNSGLTRVKIDDQGPVRMMPGDELLSGTSVDLIKIDVEGMEMDVLAGLAETIRSFRPEIADRNAASARAYFSELSYEGVFESRDYHGFTNVLFIAQKSKPSV